MISVCHDNNPLLRIAAASVVRHPSKPENPTYCHKGITQLLDDAADAFVHGGERGAEGVQSADGHPHAGTDLHVWRDHDAKFTATLLN
jgi:hypothetical protein